MWPLGVALLVGIGLLAAGETLLAAAVLFGGIPLGLASSVAGETFAMPVRPGVRPKLLADPIMMIPLLGMQIVSGVGGGRNGLRGGIFGVAAGVGVAGELPAAGLGDRAGAVAEATCFEK